MTAHNINIGLDNSRYDTKKSNIIVLLNAVYV